MRPPVRRALGAALAVAAVHCKPDLDQTVSIVSSERVLGVRSVPAESLTNGMEQVSFSTLVVDEKGVITNPPAEWDFCAARNPLANLGPVDPSCEQPGSASLVRFGGGGAAVGVVPTDACSQFGPNPPAPLPGQPPGRPVDPDPTGGYYQPVSVFVAGPEGQTLSTLHPLRISCGFAGVDPASSGILTSRYHLNENPAVASLSVLRSTADGGVLTLQPLPLDGASGTATNEIPAGQHVNLEVAWPLCPLKDVCGDGICGADEGVITCPADCKMPQAPGQECTGAERYVNYDLATYSVVDLREGIHVAWYATGGAFDADRTGRDGTDLTTSSDNGWQAPSAPGTVHLWVVLADDRGGLGWSGYALNVK